jgi:hypothetical protein
MNIPFRKLSAANVAGNATCKLRLTVPSTILPKVSNNAKPLTLKKPRFAARRTQCSMRCPEYVSLFAALAAHSPPRLFPALRSSA